MFLPDAMMALAWDSLIKKGERAEGVDPSATNLTSGLAGLDGFHARKFEAGGEMLYRSFIYSYRWRARISLGKAPPIYRAFIGIEVSLNCAFANALGREGFARRDSCSMLLLNGLGGEAIRAHGCEPSIMPFRMASIRAIRCLSSSVKPPLISIRKLT
jgi:hypothetical protein